MEDGNLECGLTFMLQRAGEASWPPWSIVCDILTVVGFWIVVLVSRPWDVVAEVAMRSEVDVETRVVG
jgi:hypothetical protein